MGREDLKFDVALSFAGEERDYVDKVANALREMNVKILYDKFEEINLWGKNLYDYLQEVYFKQAKYTVMFVSENYAKKMWANHERQSAQARALQDNIEFILPARFDDTEIPGLLPTISYISLKGRNPFEFARMIKEKVIQPSIQELFLVDHYPKLGQKIKTKDVKNIFLRFNNPIDRDSESLIRNYYIQANCVCQWNICGWIEFAEGDRLLKWHVKENKLFNIDSYGPLEFDYPRFEIQIGIKDSRKIKDIYGNELPYTTIQVKIVE